MRKFIVKNRALFVFTLFFSLIICAFGYYIAHNIFFSKADEGFKMLNPEIYINESDYSKNGIKFTAEIGESYSETAEYRMFIVPFKYISSLDAGAVADSGILTAIKDKTTNLVDVKCVPHKDASINSGKPETYYVSASLISVKFDNINEDWFGLAYYVDGGETVFASVISEGQNVANLPYLASVAINGNSYGTDYDAAKSDIIKGYIADGYDKASGNAKGSTDYNFLTGLFDTESISVAPNKKTAWDNVLPDGLKIQIEYSCEDAEYAKISDSGIIEGVRGDGDKTAYKNVYAKALGRQYAKPVHVYSIETAITSDADVMCTGDAIIDGVQYYKTANFGGLKIDGEDAFGKAEIKWFTTNPNVSISEQGVAECNFTGDINGKYFHVYYKCDIGGVIFFSPLKRIRVIVPKSFGVLRFAKSVKTVYDLKAEEIFGTGTGEVIKEVYDSENLTENLFSGGTVDVSNVPMGDRVFKIKTAFSVVEIKAIVADVIINDAEDFKEFLTLRSKANNDKTDYNYGWKDKNSDGVVDDGERIYYALGNNIIIGRTVAKKYRNDGFAGLLDNKKTVGFLGIFDGCGYTITAMDVRDGGLFGDLGYGSVIKNLGCNLKTVQSSSYKCVVFACIMWGATIDNCYIEYKQTHASADYVGMSDASKATVMSNTVIYAYQKSTKDKTGVVVSYAAGGKASVVTDNVILIYRSDNSYFAVRSKSGGGVDTWDDSIEGLYKIDGTTNPDSFDYGQQNVSLIKTVNGQASSFSNANFNSKYFDTDTVCGVPKWKNG